MVGQATTLGYSGLLVSLLVVTASVSDQAGKRPPAGEVELLLPDTSRRVLKGTTTDERKPLTGSAIPGGLVRTPDELRDLLAYLLRDHPQPP